MARGRFDPIELEKLRERHTVSAVLTQFGVRLKKAGREYIGYSPFNKEKTPSFTVNDEKQFFHDFSSGQHGDVFDVVMHFKGCNFVGAVEFLGGAQEVTAEDRARIAQKRKERDEEEERERASTQVRIARAFDSAQPIAGTHAALCLEARGLIVDPSWTFDLRYSPSILYRGFANEEAGETEDLGHFPAMLAAIRDVEGGIIGLHRTYLDPDKPVKLRPPGDQTRNRAKKILGEQSGGMILLSPMGSRLALGEGIETVRSWYVLGHGGDDISIASAVSLGNLAGGSEGTVVHPNDSDRRVPNGVPDLERPGVAVQPEVEEMILLGDGDSEPIMTRMRLLVAARRFRHQGRDVFVHMAPAGKDFNNVLMSQNPEELA